MGKKTPFYRWGKIQPLCSQPAQSGTTAHGSGTTTRVVEALWKTTARRQKASITARAVLPLVLMVLPLGIAVLLLRVAVLLLASGTKKILPCLPPLDKTRDFGPEWYYRSGAAVVPLWSGSKKLHPLQAAVVPLQPFKNTKTATTSANGLRIQQNQVCWKANDMG